MPPQFVVEGFPTILRDKHQYLRNDARMPHCLRWGGMASLLGGLGDRFPQHNRDLPSKAPPLAAGIFTMKFPGTPTGLSSAMGASIATASRHRRCASTTSLARATTHGKA